MRSDGKILSTSEGPGTNQWVSYSRGEGGGWGGAGGAVLVRSDGKILSTSEGPGTNQWVSNINSYAAAAAL